MEVDLGAARTYIIKLYGNECYHENSYVISSKNAGCEENGYRTYKCMGCGYEYTETIAPTGHSYKDGRCEYCYEEYLPSEGERYVVGTYNHNGIQYTFYSDFTADRVIKTADGMANRENGRWLYVTAGDRSEIEVYFNGGAEIIELGKDMCAHKNRKESIRVPSSCVKAGFESFICGDCGESIRIELPISSHIYLNGKCITCGTEEEKVCEHKDVMETGTEAPTCDMPGMVHYRCLDCGEEYTCDIAPLGHDYYNGVCNNCGESEKAEDEEFGRYMTDGLTITFFGNNRFDALRMHMNAVGELVEDHVEGEWWYTYLNGMEYIDLYLDGELWRFVYVAERGMYDRVDIGNNEGEEPKPERYIVNELWYNNVFYTFYSDGSVDRLVKSENGEYLESGSWYYVNEMKTELEAVFGAEIVWIKLHEDECKHESMETVNVQEPGCTTEGYYTYRCNNCGYEYIEVIEPVGHSFDSEGWCFRCGTYESELPRYLVTRIIQDGAEYNFYSDGVVEKIVKSEDGKTYLHMGDWYYADEAKTKIAAIFGDEYLEFYLSECDHNYHCLESSEPACGRDGYYVYECRNCGERYTETIAGTNHVFDDYGRCIYCGAKADWAGGDEDPEKTEITVITGSAEKIYDGRPFMYNNFYVNGLPEGYRVEAVLGASIKDVGVVENYVSQLAVYDYNGNDVTQDFNVTYDYGFLRVVPARFCVISGSATKVYDGIPLVCESFEVVAEDPIPEQFSISADIFGLQTEVGSSPNVVGTVRVFDEYGCDITHCFDITIEYGELIVNAPEDDYPKEEEHPDSPMVCDHDYQCVDSSLPTCGSNGYYLYECVNCGDSYTETIVGTNHVFDDSGRCVYCGAKADLAGGDENNGDGEPSREVVATYKQNGIEYILYSDKKAEKLVKTESGENYSEEGHWYYVSNTEAEAVFYDEVIRIKLSNDEEDTGLMAIYEEESVRIEFYTDYRYEATISSWNEETGDTTFETYQGDWWREYNNGRELTVIEFMGDYMYFVCNENGYAGRVEIENGENPPTDEVQSYGVYKDNGYNITLYSDNTYSGTYEATIDGKYIRESIDGYWEWEMERDIYIVHGYNGERLPLAMTGDGGFYLTGYDLEDEFPDTPMVCGHYGAFVESTLDGNCVSEGYRYYFCPDCGERWVENTGFGKHNIEGDYCLDCGMEFLFLFEYRTTRFIMTKDGQRFEVEAVYVFFNDGSCDLQSYGYLDGKLVDDWREYSFKRNEQGEFVVYDENGNYVITVVYDSTGKIYHY